jgi:SRSO17 transposase
VKSAGVQRQYSGTAGRIENCQVGVFLALAGSRGRALVDRELYLPQGWCDDRARCGEAGVPADVAFATKPQLAARMLKRAFDAGLEPRYVLADEVYGSDGKFRRFLEEKGRPYVLAVTSQQRLWVQFEQKRVGQIVQSAPSRAWFRLSVGDGSKGPRAYDWAASTFGLPSGQGLVRWLLVRRGVDEPQETAYRLCLDPPQATARDLAVAAGKRWSIECCFEAAKQETGLDEYEVRSRAGWHRHVTLSMLALAFLAAVRARAGADDEPPERRPRRQPSSRRSKRSGRCRTWSH